MKKLGLISLALLASLSLAVSAFAATKTLTTTMTGKAETPKGDPNGKGSAKITLNTSTGKVCFNLKWSGIGNPVAAHIHKGKKGVAGPVVIPFFGGAAKHTGCVKASKSLVRKIVKTPAAYYVNVHTQAYPGGAVRGQLQMSWHPTRKSVSAAMAGKLDGATGSALITLERVKGRVCFRLNWSGIGTPVAAYIQQAAGGSAVVPLFVDAPKRRGCVKVPKALIRQIAECPSSYYVTVHTHSRPGGALLGRL